MNSDVIKLLPDSVANQIAAGEVIQRPASVIKELVENAIDAGADEITIILKDAGRTLIQVIDNGCGMSPADARMAFERHATSKISQASDLFGLHTMGFRGEALPSIAAVAQIDMRTMRHGDPVGTRICLAESKFESQEPATCTPGTNLMVKNIFFHMPARRKFLKKDTVELSHIMREFERQALVNTNVAFTLINNDVTLHKFLKGSFKQRITDLFGNALESQLASVATETSLVKISGFTGMPRFARKRGAHQFFFVNGRNMRHPFFHKSLTSCYEQLISADSQPCYFINFEVDPSTIDVNIHPQKNEIKFEHELAIRQILMAAVKETLGRVHAAGAIDFDVDDAPDIPIFDPSAAVADTPGVEFDPGYNPFDESPADTPVSIPAMPVRRPSGSNSGTAGLRPSASQSRAPMQDWEKLYENFSRERDNSIAGARSSSMNDNSDITPPEDLFGDITENTATAARNIPTCLQLRSRYIVTPSHGGLMLIDQHRAHIRILFDRYSASLALGNGLPSQKLIFPESITLSPSENAVLSAIADSLPQLGFDISFLGDNTWAINGAPSLPATGNPADTLRSIIEEAAESGTSSAADITAPLAKGMAHATAIRAGDVLSSEEMDSIVADLFRCTSPAIDPDGLKTLNIISTEEIAALFTVK